jgi:Pyruvate/2-oxoacid:ferredoxin oxidoreductase delta subunit
MGDLRKVAEKAGIFDVVHEERARFVDLDEAVQVKNAGRFQRFEVARAACEADAIINLPKLKTHGMTTLTGAVKNLFGCIPGKRKVQWHFNTGVNHALFMRMLVELYAFLEPRLTIMDAVVGMEGNGPGSGDPREIGALLAGRDAVSVDVVSAMLVGVAPAKLPVLQAALEAGIGETKPARITVLGEPLESLAVRNFRLPPRAHLEWRLPEWARSSLKNAFTSRPVIDSHSCIQCGICQGHCPQGAIKNRGTKLEIRYRDCIRCFCCQEFCPQGAITVGKGWALFLLPE